MTSELSQIYARLAAQQDELRAQILTTQSEAKRRRLVRLWQRIYSVYPVPVSTERVETGEQDGDRGGRAPLQEV
ncbi:hypothetical protein ACF1GT_36040 [Streptomyces sp. NPDC014636]|uniref:hypothetical protein n=1 Tax=Streptomyces sp. NPDC014636 TaxID=3364876 RepID=UPI0036FE7F69